MAFVYPYSAEFFIDHLVKKWTETTFTDQRYDENSMQGSGHNIPAELAAPKWLASMAFTDLEREESLFLETRIRKLHGQLNELFIYDPRRRYPKYDPDGSILGSSAVKINSIGANQQSMTLKGLPINFQINIGDKGQIVYGTGRNYFFEFSESVVASNLGVTPAIEVWPHIPLSVLANIDVILKKPCCKMTVESFNPGKSSSLWSSGATIDLLEHI